MKMFFGIVLASIVLAGCADQNTKHEQVSELSVQSKTLPATQPANFSENRPIKLMVEVQNSRAKLSWQAFPGAVGYVVSINNHPWAITTDTIYDTGPILMPETSYSFQVKAIMDKRLIPPIGFEDLDR